MNNKNKIPYIKVSKKEWDYIIPHLMEWGYEPATTLVGLNFEDYPLLVIDSEGKLGKYNNHSLSCVSEYKRYQETDIEKFLAKAARLKGFVYYNKKKPNTGEFFTKDDLKPGMVIELRKGERRIVLESNYDGLFLLGISDYGKISNYEDCLTSKSYIENFDIMKVYKIETPCSMDEIMNDDKCLELVWERDEVIEYTMQEIADKIGVPVEKLRIKK